MNCLSQQILTRSCLTGNQQGGIGPGQDRHKLQNLLHFRAMPKHALHFINTMPLAIKLPQCSNILKSHHVANFFAGLTVEWRNRKPHDCFFPVYINNVTFKAQHRPIIKDILKNSSLDIRIASKDEITAYSKDIHGWMTGNGLKNAISRNNPPFVIKQNDTVRYAIQQIKHIKPLKGRTDR